MNATIKHSWFYAVKPEIIWAYLTEPHLLSQWLMPNYIVAKTGHQFMFHTKAIPTQDFDGKIFCEVLDLVPFKKLVYSWKGGPGNGQITLDSVVTWTLLPKNNGTELLLEHTGFNTEINLDMYQAMDKGWKHILGKMEGLINKTASNETNTHR